MEPITIVAIAGWAVAAGLGLYHRQRVKPAPVPKDIYLKALTPGEREEYIQDRDDREGLTALWRVCEAAGHSPRGNLRLRILRRLNELGLSTREEDVERIALARLLAIVKEK